MAKAPQRSVPHGPTIGFGQAAIDELLDGEVDPQSLWQQARARSPELHLVVELIWGAMKDAEARPTPGMKPREKRWVRRHKDEAREWFRGAPALLIAEECFGGLGMDIDGARVALEKRWRKRK